MTNTQFYISICALLLITSCGEGNSSNNSAQLQTEKEQIEEVIVKQTFASELSEFIRKSNSQETSDSYNYIKIIAECGDNPEPESSSINDNTYSNDLIEIIFDSKLGILEIIDLEDYKTIGQIIQEDINNGIEISPWDEMMMGSSDYESRDSYRWDEIWDGNAETFKGLADSQVVNWNSYSGPNKKYVEYISKYYEQLKKNEDVLCAWCFSFQINEIFYLTALNSRTCSNATFTIFEDSFSVNDKSYDFDSINYLDNSICIFTKNNQRSIASKNGQILHLPNDIALNENMFYCSDFEFYLPEAGSERGVYKVYEFRKSRQVVLNELSQIGGEYVGGGVQRTVTHRQVWKEHLSIEQNMILYGNSAWATDETLHRSDDVSIALNEQNWNLGVSTYDIKAIAKQQSNSIQATDHNAGQTTSKCKVSNLNFRSTPEISDNIIGKIQLGEEVVVLDTVAIKIDVVTNALLNKETFIDINGSQILFKQGVAMKLVEEVDNENYKVIVNDRGDESVIAKSNLDLIDEEVWVKIKLNNGKEGYVYQKYIE